MDPVQLPRQIDEPPTVLLWNTDELAPIVLLHVIGIFTGNVLIMTAVGFAASSLYKRFRDGHPDGYLQHLLYWIGLMPTSARTIRNPFADHYKP